MQFSGWICFELMSNIEIILAANVRGTKLINSWVRSHFLDFFFFDLRFFDHSRKGTVAFKPGTNSLLYVEFCFYMMSRLSLSVHFPSYLKELVSWNLFGKGESTDNIGIFNVPWCLAVWQMLLVWYTTSIFLVTSRVCDFLIAFFIFKITFYSFFENQTTFKKHFVCRGQHYDDRLPILWSGAVTNTPD